MQKSNTAEIDKQPAAEQQIKKADGRAKNGGKREGGGRPTGSKNKRSEESIALAKAKGVMPLEFLLDQMNNDQLPRDVRMDAAKAAAPYCHARLQAIEMNAHVTNHESALEQLK